MGKEFNTNVSMNWISTDIKHEAAKTVTPAAEPEQVESKSENTSTEKKPSTPKEKKPKTESQPFTIVGKELKTRQTSLLLKESTYSKLESLAKKNGISVNSCINQILEQVLN